MRGLLLTQESPQAAHAVGASGAAARPQSPAPSEPVSEGHSSCVAVPAPAAATVVAPAPALPLPPPLLRPLTLTLTLTQTLTLTLMPALQDDLGPDPTFADAEQLPIGGRRPS